MIESTTGLILRTRPLTETSLIVQWLTPDLGRIAMVAKGARRPKSPFRGKLDLFYSADFSFTRSRRSELHALREVSVRETHSFLRRDFVLLHQVSYAAALIEQATETETPLPEIYRLMCEFLEVLPAHSPDSQSVLALELKLLGELGLEPGASRACLTAGTREFLQTFSNCDWDAVSRLRLSTQQSEELERFLHDFIVFHLGKIPRSRANALRG